MTNEKELIYISNSLLPSQAANSVHVMKMCNAFSDIGFNVQLLAKTKKSNVNMAALFDYFNVKESFSLKLWKVTDFLKIGLLVSFIVFPLIVIIEKAKHKNIIIYSRNRHSSFLLSLLNLKHTYELHGIASSRLELFFDSYILREKSKNKVVVISNELKKDIILKFETNENRVYVAHDAADAIDSEKIDDIKLLGNGKVNVGYVGSLLEGKGVDLLCEAANFFPEINFHVVGGSDEHVRAYKNNFSKENIFFYGHVSQNEVLSFLKVFEIVVLPNKKNVFTANNENIGKYTSPLKLFEYMSFGKNIVASNIPVFREVLRPSHATFFESNCIQSLVEALERAIHKESYNKSVYNEFLGKYTWKVRANFVTATN